MPYTKITVSELHTIFTKKIKYLDSSPMNVAMNVAYQVTIKGNVSFLSKITNEMLSKLPKKFNKFIPVAFKQANKEAVIIETEANKLNKSLNTTFQQSTFNSFARAVKTELAFEALVNDISSDEKRRSKVRAVRKSFEQDIILLISIVKDLSLPKREELATVLIANAAA